LPIAAFAAMLKAIHASEDVAAEREKAIRVIEKLRGLRLTRADVVSNLAIRRGPYTCRSDRRLSPEVLKSIRRQLGVAHHVLNVLVPEPCLQRPRVVPGIG